MNSYNVYITYTYFSFSGIIHIKRKTFCLFLNIIFRRIPYKKLLSLVVVVVIVLVFNQRVFVNLD